MRTGITTSHRAAPKIVSKELDVDYVEVLNIAANLGRIPSLYQQRLHSNMIRRFKEADVWQYLSVFHLYAHNATPDFSNVSWTNRQSGFNVGELQIQNWGITGVASVNYVRTNATSVVGTNANNVFWMCHELTNRAQNSGALFGARSGAGSASIRLYTRSASNQLTWTIESNSGRTVNGITDSTGHWALVGNVTDRYLYRNKILIDQFGAASANPISTSMNVTCDMLNGNPTAFGQRSVGYILSGNPLLISYQQIIKEIMEEYYVAMNLSV